MAGDVRGRARARHARIEVIVFPSMAAHEGENAAYWAAIPVAERVMEVWRLSEEQWRLRGEFFDEPGLHRSVTRLVRR